MSSLRNHFLIAMPSLMDPNFHQTVTYICEHNSEGAMGIVINRPLQLHLEDVLKHMDVPLSVPQAQNLPVLAGGPVQRERGFVIHRPVEHWSVSLCVAEDIAVTTSRDVLEAIAQHEGPAEALIALGYAGWGAGQLEREIAENAWLNSPASSEILFHTAFDRRWHAAAALLGIDLGTLSGEVGHA